jgi:hypothetical protein
MTQSKKPRPPASDGLEALIYKQIRAKFGPDVTITFRYPTTIDAINFGVSQKVGDHIKDVSSSITGLDILQAKILEAMVEARVDFLYEQWMLK